MSMHCIFKMRQVIIMVMFVITGFVFTMQLGCSGALKSNVIESASKSTPSTSSEQGLPTVGNSNGNNNNSTNNNTSAGMVSQNCQVSTSTSGVVTVLHSRSQAFFKRNEVTSPSTCQSQVRLCNNGYLSGSYTATYCKVKINSATGAGSNSGSSTDNTGAGSNTNSGSGSNSGSNAGRGTGTIVTTTSTTSTTSTTTSTTLPPSGSIGVGNNPANPYAHGVVPVVSADSGKWKVASRKASGKLPRLDSHNPRISANGRYVVFEANGAGIVDGDQNPYTDIFLRDMQTGAVTQVSAGNGGPNASLSNNISSSPDISADGRWVVFASRASNLVPGDSNNATDIFLYDSSTQQVSLVSQTESGVAANGFSSGPVISGDGMVVVFLSSALNLVDRPALDSNIGQQVFVKNLETGRIEHINAGLFGVNSNSISVNSDGSVIAFDVYNENTSEDSIFVHKAGVSMLISTRKDGAKGKFGNNGDSSINPKLTKVGDKVAFDSYAYNLVPGDTNDKCDVFLKNIITGDIQRVSESQNGQQANGHSTVLSISDDGRYVVFSSEATNLIDGVAVVNGKIGIFVKDMITKQVTRISDASDPARTSINSRADISGDGSTVVFSSDADNLVDGDDNYSADIFWGH